MDELEVRFSRARETGDTAALAHLFAMAADLEDGDTGRAFMLTQAYALGLEAGLPETTDWHFQLVRLGANDADDAGVISPNG